MKTAQYVMQREHAPPGFWPWGQQTALVAGIELESAAPTRFFQTVDAYPRKLGRLSWRLQLNTVVGNAASVPMFRTFYPGIEWNLREPGGRWFLTAWFRWDRNDGESGEPRCASIARIEGDTVVFALTPPEQNVRASLYLRSRVDSRERNRIADAVRLQSEEEAISSSTVIDLIDLREPT